VKKLLVTALASATAVVCLGAPGAQSSAGSRDVRMLRTPTAAGISADGSLAVVATGCGPREYELYAWNPLRRSVVSLARRRERRCYGSSTGEGIWEAAIAGHRVAWVAFAGGNYRQSWLLTASTRRPLATFQLTDMKDRNTDSGVGDWVGNVHGDGSLLVFNTWSLCEKSEDTDSCPPGSPPGFHIYNENLWRIVGRHKRLILASPDEMTVLAVAAGRILVRRADGSLELRGADGSLLHAFPYRRREVRAALLDASELVVLDRASGLTWRVYDPASGDQKRMFRAQKNAEAQDVERGLLVYTVGRVVHVLRLADRRQKTFVAPAVPRPDYPLFVQAALEPSGLFYSYPVRSEGRVRFVPFNQIRFR